MVSLFIIHHLPRHQLRPLPAGSEAVADAQLRAGRGLAGLARTRWRRAWAGRLTTSGGTAGARRGSRRRWAGQLVERVLGRSHRIGGNDAMRRRSRAMNVSWCLGSAGLIQLPFGHLGAKSAPSNRLDGPARPSSRARCCTPPAPGAGGADPDLPEDGVLPRGEPHVARQRQPLRRGPGRGSSRS